MIINHNLSAIFATRQLKVNNFELEKTTEKLSSGLAINRASDNAAGLAVSEKMRGQIRGLKQAYRNASDGISFIQTTEGHLASSTAIVQRMRELAVQASNGIYTHEDRMQIQVEISQLVDEIDRIASHAQFNTINMLTGRFAKPSDENSVAAASIWIHVGANMDQRERLFIGTMTSKALNLIDGENKIVSLSTPGDANKSIAVFDAALTKLSKTRADLGAYQNRLEFASKGILIAYENLQAAESRIRDTDMAEEMVDFTRDNILTQAATAMLSQANMRPSLVLQLIR